MPTANRYSIRGTKSSNASRLTLYEACRALAGAALRGDLYDGAHVSCDRRSLRRLPKRRRSSLQEPRR